MAAAMAVIGLGIGLGAFGLLAPDMYVIGLVIVFIGIMGVVVWLGERYRRTRG